MSRENREAIKVAIAYGIVSQVWMLALAAGCAVFGAFTVIIARLTTCNDECFRLILGTVFGLWLGVWCWYLERWGVDRSVRKVKALLDRGVVSWIAFIVIEGSHLVALVHLAKPANFESLLDTLNRCFG
jgi:hypothetical protein